MRVIADKAGFILADLKLEFGKLDNEIILGDSIGPDEYRLWPKDQYEAGKPQPSFDKQYVRDYLDSVGWDHNPPPPHLPENIVKQTSAKYREALERFI